MLVDEAKDDILTLFRDAWLASQDSSEIYVFYDSKNEDSSKKDSGKSWSRITIRHFENGFPSPSLSSSSGVKKYNRAGVITVGIFTPIGEGTDLDSRLTKIVMDAYEGKSSPNGVWFRNVRFNEVGVSGSWFQTNVKINFEYSEYK